MNTIFSSRIFCIVVFGTKKRYKTHKTVKPRFSWVRETCFSNCTAITCAGVWRFAIALRVTSFLYVAISGHSVQHAGLAPWLFRVKLFRQFERAHAHSALIWTQIIIENIWKVSFLSFHENVRTRDAAAVGWVDGGDMPNRISAHKPLSGSFRDRKWAKYAVIWCPKSIYYTLIHCLLDRRSEPGRRASIYLFLSLKFRTEIRIILSVSFFGRWDMCVYRRPPVHQAASSCEQNYNGWPPSNDK